MTVAAPSPRYRGPAPHQGGATNRPIVRIVVHCTAGAEPGQEGAADSTIDFTRRSGVQSSYHYVRDAKVARQFVYDGEVSYHCGKNNNSIGYELCCSLSNEGGILVRATAGAKALTHWQTPSHRAMLRGAAEDIARLCIRENIPIRKLTVAQVRAGEKGLCGHVDIRSAFPGVTTHWDPGPFFPWRRFIRMTRRAARRLLAEDAAPTPEPQPSPEPESVPEPAPEVSPIDPADRVYLCLAGDWNEGPASRGRYSPWWIAKRAKLRMPDGWVGIDYAMTSALLSEHRRIPGSKRPGPGGSDHWMVAFTVTNPVTGQVLRGATYNVMRDRTPEELEQLRTWLLEVLVRERLDFVCVQEIREQRYHDMLGGLEGFELLAAREPDGVEHNGILVREGLPVRGFEAKLTSTVGWVTVTGGNHDPSSVALATVDGWLIPVSLHEAPSVNWRQVAGVWVPVGPPRRVAVRIASARTLAKIGRYWLAQRQALRAARRTAERRR